MCVFCGAGRAGEELVYGGDEVSTLNQRRLVLARRIASKLVVSAGMSDASLIGPRTVSDPVRHGGRALKQIILPRVRARFARLHRLSLPL
jgi:ATP-dependent Zn protease